MDLDFTPDDAVMGEWDVEEVRRLFTSLEFRSLFDRLMELAKDVKPKVEVAELDLRRVEPEDLAGILADGPVGVAIQEEADVLVGLAVSAGGAQAAYAALPDPARSPTVSPTPSTRKWTHDAKALERVTLRAGAVLEGVAFDTMLAGYLLEPGTADYPLAALCERYLGTDLFGGEGEAAPRRRCSSSRRSPGGAWRRRPRRCRSSRRSWRSRSTARGSGRCSRTWSCRSRPSSRGWRRAGFDSTCRTSRTWGSRSATGWPPCTRRCSGTPGRSST